MRFAILVNSGPYQHQGSDTAWHFTRAVLDRAVGDFAAGRLDEAAAGFDAELAIRCRITLDGRGVTVDYEGSAPAQPLGINVPYCYTYAHTVYPLKCVFGPAIPNNHGLLTGRRFSRHGQQRAGVDDRVARKTPVIRGAVVIGGEKRQRAAEKTSRYSENRANAASHGRLLKVGNPV